MQRGSHYSWMINSDNRNYDMFLSIRWCTQ